VAEIVAMEPVLKAYIREAIEVEKAGLKVGFKETSEFPMPEEFQRKFERSINVMGESIKDMEYDIDRVDEMVLALLYLTTSRDQYGARAWKGIDSFTLDRLHAKGLVGDPRSKGPTVLLTEAGEKLSKELFVKFFGVER
jgi:hypothetical protein